jgi:thiamine biosynthesis lipoprotein ApbE
LVLLEAHDRVTALESELSEFLCSSPVFALNRAEPFQRIHVPQSVIDLFELSWKLRRSTQGAFDCTVKSGALARQVERPIDWDPIRCEAWRTTSDAQLSFAAIGKGYALDRIRPLIERQGFTDYLLNAGGSSLVFSGFAAPGEPWTWAWSWKKNDQGEDLGIAFSHSTGERISVGVSGIHEKGCHLIDPKTGEPASVFQSALVAHPSAGTSDALSTALFVSGGRLENKDTLAMATIDSEGIPRWNGWFRRFWGGLDQTASLMIGSVLAIALTSVSAWADSADEAVDLGSLGANQFNPYLFERHQWLVVLPVFAVGLVLIHLIKFKKQRSLAAKRLLSKNETIPTQ